LKVRKSSNSSPKGKKRLFSNFISLGCCIMGLLNRI
jgi:hypothetical protein